LPVTNIDQISKRLRCEFWVDGGFEFFACAVIGIWLEMDACHAGGNHAMLPRRAGFAGRFHPYALRQSRCSEGGRLCRAFSAPSTASNPLIVRVSRFSRFRGFVVASLMARGNADSFTPLWPIGDRRGDDDARSYVTFHSTHKRASRTGRP